MKLDYIDQNKLVASRLNVRKHGGGDVTNLVASIRSLGLLQPLLVRPDGDGFEIVAGQQRFAACQALLAEGCDLGPLPCLVMAEGDDAVAIEASLAENTARLPMDELDQYQAFAALVKQGRACEDIAAHFGVSERLVKQRLAIANLYTPILNAYRRDEIAASTLRILTMATTRQQKAWWKKHTSDDEWAPLGPQLKSWLFGGAHVPTVNTLFDLPDYPGAVVTDLFGEDSYFADSDTFWEFQNKAIAARIEEYRTGGWADVVLHDVGQYWQRWDYEQVAKEDGGAVHVVCTADGEVTFHEGVLSRQQLNRRRRSDEATAPTPKAEVSRPLQNYLDLHRHAAVRTALLQHSGVALRLMVAHVVAGSTLWHVKPEPRRAESSAIASSLENNAAEAAFADERAAVLELLGRDHEGTLVRASSYGAYAREGVGAVFARLQALNDDDVMRILSLAMAETLAVGGELIDELGQLLAVDMRQSWQPQDTFFTLLRNKPAINAMVAELAGEETAKSHLTSTGRVQKKILEDCLSGARSAQVANWLPRYMAFPAGCYLGEDGVVEADMLDAGDAELRKSA
ncbi:ParB/RepB/Spo0J family partition protein [uncultured Roseibium sp.]|uniref:ParB/RepB/Spo0J family partition protein n=1 Tax=uncultured Roseibium sp. TaxID=1936171 RepID=UPI002638EEAF|nr:ParB/RepB/Spo0J family partition protein [uncultured Roseibium sp.]